MKIGLYPRVSTQEQARGGYSIGEQIERLKSYCAAKGWTVYKIYTDAGFSGANMNRPGLTELIGDVENHKIDAVLVYKLDRLSRSQKDTLFLIEDVFMKNNVDFASITENFDTSTPFGRAMIGMLSVFAQLEREQFRERSAMGREARAKEGLHHGGTAPVGYDYVNGQLITNEFEAMQIRELFRLFVDERKSIGEISKIMSHCGKWQHESRVRAVLQNPLYAGWIRCRGDLYRGQHSAIIPQELFDCAQEIFKSRARSNPNAHVPGGTSLLSGMIWCRQCGARYFKTTKTTVKNGKRYSYEKYICYSRCGGRKYMVKNPSCKNKIIDMNELDKLIVNEFKKLLIIPTRTVKSGGSELPVLRKKRIDEIERRTKRLTELYINGNISMESVSERLAALDKERGTLEEEIEVLPSNSSQRLSNDSRMMKAALEILIKRIEVDGDDVFIYWNFS